MAEQAANQFNNTIGSLSSSFPSVANSAIFNNGVMNTTAAVQQAFGSQLGNAVGLATYQLGNDLTIFPFPYPLSPGIYPFGPFNNSFYNAAPTTTTTTGTAGTAIASPGAGANQVTEPGTGFTNLYSALAAVPTTTAGFYPGVNTAFTNTMQAVDGTLGTYLGYPSLSSGVTTLPTGPFTSIYTPAYTGYGGGFNNGYGTGYAGFGVTPEGQSANFGTGYNGMVAYNNNVLGFIPSAFSGFGVTT